MDRIASWFWKHFFCWVGNGKGYLLVFVIAVCHVISIKNVLTSAKVSVSRAMTMQVCCTCMAFMILYFIHMIVKTQLVCIILFLR